LDKSVGLYRSCNGITVAITKIFPGFDLLLADFAELFGGRWDFVVCLMSSC
jgi:hypothetical protein